MRKLLNYTKDVGEFKEGRPNRQSKRTPDFWLENCTAVKACFEYPHRPEFSFNIWVSYENEYEVELISQKNIEKRELSEQDSGDPGKLFLLENFESKDHDFAKRVSSPYSVLQELGLILDCKLENKIS